MDANNPENLVLVIGAGLVGAMIAYHLANHGRRVVVLEAQKIAQGATRRAIGLATPQLSRDSTNLSDTLRGVDAITSLAMHLKVAVRSCRVLHLASKPADTDDLHALCETLNTGRPRLTWETRQNLIPQGYRGGVVVHNSVLLDLEALTSRLLQHPNIQVQEQAEVHRLEWHAGRLSALAHGYTVRAGAIVLATNAFAGMLSPYLADSAPVVRGVTWTSQSLERDRTLLEQVLQSVSMPLIVDHAHLVAAQTLDFRLRIHAWHWDNAGADDPADDIRAFLRAHLPDLLDHSDGWHSGATTVTRDGAPLIGKLAGEGTVLYALGAGMYGPAWAPVIAERILRMLEG